MRAVVFGYHDVGCRTLRSLAGLGVDIVRAYTHADDPDETCWFASFADTCRDLDVPVQVGADPHAEDELRALRAGRPDALFSAYYRHVLRPSVIGTARHGGVNLHGSLLPRYRGRAPVNWQLLHGETRSGVTLHTLAARPDCGDVIDQEPFPIGRDDRPTDVFARVASATDRVLARSARGVLDGSAPRHRQLESNATTFGRRRPADGRLDLRLAAEDVRNHVRAVTRPYPGAFAHRGRDRVAIWWAETGPPAPGAPPGTVLEAGPKPLVACGGGTTLRLTDVAVSAPSPATEARSLEVGQVLTGHPEGAPR